MASRKISCAEKVPERMFVGYVDGRLATYPTKCHNEGQEKPVPVIEAIRRHFHLTEEYGISDKEFYSAMKFSNFHSSIDALISESVVPIAGFSSI